MAQLNDEFIDARINEVREVDDPAEQKQLNEERERNIQSAIDAEKHALGDDAPKR